MIEPVDACMRLHPQEHDDAFNACLAELSRRGIFDPMMINAVGVAIIYWGLNLIQRDVGEVEHRRMRAILAKCVATATHQKPISESVG